MKLASSSASFDAVLSAGALTQLEWLDLCARELALDGVVFDARHFPRTDDEYVAQCKKLATDLGLTIAGLSYDALLHEQPGDEADPGLWLGIAVALGAPLAIAAAPPSGGDANAWPGFVALARRAAAEAKRRNVVLAVRNVPETLCASAADLKRLAKDVDSSWLRFSLDPAGLDASGAPADLLPKAVVAQHTARAEDAGDLGRAIEALGGFRGFLALDYAGEGDPKDVLGRIVSDARTIAAQDTLEHRRP